MSPGWGVFLTDFREKLTVPNAMESSPRAASKIRFRVFTKCEVLAGSSKLASTASARIQEVSGKGGENK